MTEILRNEKGHFIKGQSGNPSGRPALPVSITKALQQRLSDNPHLADEIIDDWLNLTKSREQAMPAIREILERIDGKVADKHLNVNVTTTPELLQQAQRELLQAQETETKLLNEYGGEDG